MKETAQRLRTRLDLCKKLPHIIGCADIRRHDAHFYTALLQVLNKLAGLRTGSAAPAREQKMAPTPLRQPPSQHFAISAESAGNEIASVRLYLEPRAGKLAAPRNQMSRERDGNFADMFSARHETKRGIDARRGKRSIRQRPQRALFHQFGNLLQNLAH